jgi:S-(hydroxymethyl)glutathione dehydrogenase / alcohol dehydrogenase
VEHGSAVAVIGLGGVGLAALMAAKVRAITGRRGADCVFEAVGRQATIETAVDATRRGGTTYIVGAAPPDERISLSAYDLYMHGKTLVGCQYGSVVPPIDFPLVLNLWRTGRLPLERLITGRIALDDAAFDDLTRGTGIRSVIVNGGTA